jgi:hypothetical protein
MTCLNSCAVHLEVAFGLDTDSFLNAFYRIVNRRGLPIRVITKLPNSEQSYKGKVKSHNYITDKSVNNRKTVKEVISDNGTNFFEANNELQELVSLLDKDKMNDAICNQGIKWHSNPPLAPPFGGVHATMIKAAK